MSQKPLIIFSSDAFSSSMRQLKWRWIMVPLVLALVFAGVRALMPTQYEASAVLAPSEERTGGLAELAGGLSGLAGLAGLDLGGSRLDNTILAIEIMQSRSFIHMLIEDHDLLPYLLPDEEAPEVWQGYGPFRDLLIIENDRATRILRLGVEHPDPEFAARLVAIMVAEINRYMRARDKANIDQQIAYLTEVAQNAQQAEVRESLLYLLQEQFKRAMLVEANEDYVYETIDPAVVPHKPASFSVLVWFLIGLILGAFVMLAVTLLHAYRYADD